MIKNRFLLSLSFSAILAGPLASAQSPGAVALSADAPRQTILFDRAWQFHQGEVTGADQPIFDDSSWRTLDLPHDWMIEGVRGPDLSAMDGPFDNKSPAGADGGYLTGGIGWYRKTFTLPESAHGRHISILFDGAYMDADVTCNGCKLGNHPYGFTSFSYDLTPVLKYGGEKNVVAVRLNIVQPCSRWYSGAGLYRHVWLIVSQPVHIAQWGTSITTPKAEATNAQVNVVTQVVAETGATLSDATLTTILLDPSGKEVSRKEDAQKVSPGLSTSFNQTFSLPTAQLWSTESPALYRAVGEVRVNGALADSYTTPFGIRRIEFKKDEGFFLNGQHVQIKGVCDHHDLGCLGSAAYQRGFERQLQILKAMGCNALRTSHNPPSPELLDLCDRMGILVMDECFDEWKLNKTKYGYGRFFDEWAEKDLSSMINRDRNHPSIILWSIGNEVTEGFTPGGDKVATKLQDIVHREDPTRLVTSACQQPSNSVRLGFDQALDIFGVNYEPTMYQNKEVHARAIMTGSETASTVDTRGEYGLKLGRNGKVEIDPKPVPNQVSCYDQWLPPWATDAQQEEIDLQNAPWISGEFVWTGFDYLGEPTPYKWPSRSSYFGFLDLCGFPKDRYYLYKSVWSGEPVVHILPSSWNWTGFEGKEIPVWLFTNADSVELFLNGQSLGAKKYPADVEMVTIPLKKGKQGAPDTAAHQAPSLHLAWSVPYAPGILKAVGKKNGEIVATDELDTAGDPAKVLLEVDRNEIEGSGQDLAFIKVTLVDKDGHVCPNADNEIKFRVDGTAAKLAGVDNGDPTNHESFQGSQHKAFHGLALAVLKSSDDATGLATLTASVDGLPSAQATIQVTPPTASAQN
jgi:beta-galactosidase